MVQIKILAVGKTKESWLQEALSEYEKRLKPYAKLQFEIVRDDAALEKAISKEKAMVALDPSGQSFTSEAFAPFLQNSIEKGGARLTFIIGGPDGLPSSLREEANLLSLSKLTFTHQLARLVLVEQIYRAFEIFKGSQYHR